QHPPTGPPCSPWRTRVVGGEGLWPGKNHCSRRTVRQAFEKLRQRRADIAECCADGTGDLADAGYGNERNQGDEQRIFHQILTFFGVLQGVEFYIQLQKRLVHLSSPKAVIWGRASRITSIRRRTRKQNSNKTRHYRSLPPMECPAQVAVGQVPTRFILEKCAGRFFFNMEGPCCAGSRRCLNNARAAFLAASTQWFFLLAAAMARRQR